MNPIDYYIKGIELTDFIERLSLVNEKKPETFQELKRKIDFCFPKESSITLLAKNLIFNQFSGPFKGVRELVANSMDAHQRAHCAAHPVELSLQGKSIYHQ